MPLRCRFAAALPHGRTLPPLPPPPPPDSRHGFVRQSAGAECRHRVAFQAGGGGGGGTGGGGEAPMDDDSSTGSSSSSSSSVEDDRTDDSVRPPPSLTGELSPDACRNQLLASRVTGSR